MLTNWSNDKVSIFYKRGARLGAANNDKILFSDSANFSN